MLLGCAVGLVYIWNRIFLILILLQVTLIWLNFSSLMMINSGLLLISNLDLCCVLRSIFLLIVPCKMSCGLLKSSIILPCLGEFFSVRIQVSGHFLSKVISQLHYPILFLLNWKNICIYCLLTVDDDREMLHNYFATTN